MTLPSLHRCTGAGVVTLDVVVLRVGWVPPAQLTTQLTHPRHWVAAVGADGASLELARAGLWLAAAWLAVAVIAVLASGLPGGLGRMADGVAGRAVPAVLRRAIAAALGASVVLVPVAAGASTSGTHGGGRQGTAATATARPEAGASNLSGGWPWPTSAPTTKTTPASGVPAKPVPWPHSATPSTPRPGAKDVDVKAGDCLWAIAAHRLGPRASAHQIAAETQRWYEANAATIGSDPNLIHPGQQLHQPTEKGR